MMRYRFAVHALVWAAVCNNLPFVSSEQQFFQTPPKSSPDSASYQFEWPIRKVAVIGAGVGGLVSYREFLRAGYDVKLYERDRHPGGVWHYSEEVPLNAPVPNASPFAADYEPCLPPKGVKLPYEEEYIDQDPRMLSEQIRAHRAPKPIWASLKSNAPAIRDWKWPDDTPWELPQQMIQRYVRSFASLHGINTNDNNPNVFYNTRVELVEKRYVNETEAGWTLTLKELVKIGEKSSRVRWWKEEFDAVVIATGRYNSPSVPAIPGLSEWVNKHPNGISHSRQYRRPEMFQNKSVILVGAAASGAEIGVEINPYVSKLYVSTRPDNSTAPHYPLSFYVPRLPKNTTMIGEIKRFHPVRSGSTMSEGKIELVNGTIITGVDHIIFGTGFRYTYPFLPQYLDPKLGPNDRAPQGEPQPLVTDGSHVRSLHLDAFYIEEPTIGFININAGMQSFVYGEYLAVALAQVWNNKAKIPTTEEMWRLYNKRVEEKGGYSKHFQFLGSQVAHDMMRYFVGWLNEAATKHGGRQIDGPSAANNEILAIWAMARFGTSEFNDVAPIGGLLPFANPSWDDEAFSREQHRFTVPLFVLARSSYLFRPHVRKVMPCAHLKVIASLSSPKLSQSVHREECTQCFDGQDSDAGVDVCLACFNGACLSPEEGGNGHARLHVEKTGHGFTLNVKRRLKPTAEKSPRRDLDDEPPLKMTKLAILEEREEDKYDFITSIRCYKCNPDGVIVPESEIDEHPRIKSLMNDVMASQSSARKSEVQAWEEEILPCEHTLTLQQVQLSKEGLEKVIGQGAHCTSCSLASNLWLCLTCGNLGCGRSQFGGVEGNSHGLAHFELTRDTGEPHPVSVKLGTITAEGNADIYCYICNDSKLDPELAKHLANFGIRVETQMKTEKSMTELQIEHNLKYDFSMTGDDGRLLEPLFGGGLTGLRNLGNSCYMASVLQTMFSLSSFQKQYSPTNSDWAQTHTLTCTNPAPADCVECQMIKIADGLLSGRYAQRAQSSTTSDDDPNAPKFQEGLKPSMFKALVGKGHAEFATMKQQDAEEFFTHLLDVLRRERRRRAGGPESDESDPTRVFSYGTEQRLQCSSCRKVKYRIDGGMDVVSVSVPAVEKSAPPSGEDVDMRDATEKKPEDDKKQYKEVALKSCIDDGFLGAEAIDEWTCSQCQGKGAVKQIRFASFPDVLVVHAKKFQLVNWVPAKLDIPVALPSEDILTFDEKYLGKGLQPGETELPEEESNASALPHFDEAAMAQLTGMGFPEIRCQKALLATGGAGGGPTAAETAMEWLFAHMEDPDIDNPIQPSSSGSGGDVSEPSPEQISLLADMGFTNLQAKKALRETSGNVERAVEWLFSHPDDTGEDSSAVAEPSSNKKEIEGTRDVPVSYRLRAFISHKGPSVHSGHYVAHIRKDDGWVLFNDEKVVKADEDSVKDLKKLAYLYVFEKV